MKKIYFLSIVLCTIVNASVAQNANVNTKNIFVKENAFAGGNFTLPILQLLQGGNTQNMMLGANPHFGYTVSKNVDVAAVLNFQANKFEVSEASLLNIINNRATAKVSMLGVGVFTRLYVLDVAFLQIQPEINRITKTETTYNLNGFELPQATTVKSSIIKPSFLIGAGYKRGLTTAKTFYYASIMYDVLAKNSPYSNGILAIANNNKSTPIFLRAGFNVMLSDLKKK
jgi:hypothetical protein